MDFEAAGDALLSSSEEGAGRPGSAGDARILAFRSKVREKKERGGRGGDAARTRGGFKRRRVRCPLTGKGAARAGRGAVPAGS
jgi:hypothetical protein